MKRKYSIMTLILFLGLAGQLAASPTFYVDGIAQGALRDANNNVTLNFTGGKQNWTMLAEFAGWNAVNNFGFYANFYRPDPSLIFPGSASAVSHATTNIASGQDIGLYMHAGLDRWYGDPTLYSHTRFTTGTHDNSYQYFHVFDVRQYQGTGATFTLDTDHEDFSTSGDYDYLIYIDDSGAGPDYDHNDMIIGVSAIPEPATFILLSIGLAGVGLYRRRR